MPFRFATHPLQQWLLLLSLSLLTANLLEARIVIVGLDSGGSPDEIAFVSDQFIAAGTMLYFSEDEYDAANDRFMDIEGTAVYTVPVGGLPAGRVVILREVSTNTFTADDGGVVDHVAGNFGLSGVDEEVYVFSASNPASPLNSVTFVHCWFLIETDFGFGVGSNADPSSDVTVDIIQDFNTQLASAEYIRSRSLPTNLNDILDPANWSFGISGFPVSSTDFTGSFTLETALPVTWLEFKALASGQSSVRLEWKTADESQNVGFDVQRSTNARDWRTIGFVAGTGDSEEVETYKYEDVDLYPSQYYYRLSQRDSDGSIDYSNVESVTLKTSEDAVVLVYPNPVLGGRLRVQIVNERSFTTVGDLYRMDGKWIRSLHFEGDQLEIETNDLVAGTYLILIKTDDGVSTHRFIIP